MLWLRTGRSDRRVKDASGLYECRPIIGEGCDGVKQAFVAKGTDIGEFPEEGSKAINEKI